VVGKAAVEMEGVVKEAETVEVAMVEAAMVADERAAEMVEATEEARAEAARVAEVRAEARAGRRIVRRNPRSPFLVRTAALLRGSL
jgi:hypothetical protein